MVLGWKERKARLMSLTGDATGRRNLEVRSGLFGGTDGGVEDGVTEDCWR